MALQDLTPQLRTRLSRVERAVGWFVFLATALLIFGFGYYIYKTAERKGWFIQKINYRTSLNNATGVKVGDHVRLMGFDAGEITDVIPNDPRDYYGVTINFYVRAPYYGYLWSDSKAKVAGADLLGNRFLEVTKGTEGLPTVLERTNHVAVGLLKRDVFKQQFDALVKAGTNESMSLYLLNVAAHDPQHESEFYAKLEASPHYWLAPDESPALTERLEKLVNQAEQILPVLTNKVSLVLENGVQLTSNLTATAISARTTILSAQNVVTNLNGMVSEARLIVTNFGGVSATVNTQLPDLMDNIGKALDSLASATSNLNAQVQANGNILSTISTAVTDTDDLVQGLKRHWLLRSAFKKK
jgi:hypothetical protein